MSENNSYMTKADKIGNSIWTERMTIEYLNKALSTFMLEIYI
jgi:hypothetical protein